MLQMRKRSKCYKYFSSVCWTGWAQPSRFCHLNIRALSFAYKLDQNVTLSFFGTMVILPVFSTRGQANQTSSNWFSLMVTEISQATVQAGCECRWHNWHLVLKVKHRWQHIQQSKKVKSSSTTLWHSNSYVFWMSKSGTWFDPCTASLWVNVERAVIA